MAAHTPEPLTADEAIRLADFARACKAAARLVALYPVSHPAIQSGLARVAESAGRLREGEVVTLTVLPDVLLLNQRSAPKPDVALGELSTLLHTHLIGELTLRGDLSAERWHALLSLLARSPDDVRDQGGAARAWSAIGDAAIELRQIDYREVLRERDGTSDARWDHIIASCLEGHQALDDSVLASLFELTQDANSFKQLMERLVTETAAAGQAATREISLRLLQAFADFVARHHPEHLDRTLNQIAAAVPHLTADLVIALITTGSRAGVAEPAGIDLAGEVRARLSPQTVGEFVARSFNRDHGATARLAEAFQALVPDAERPEALSLAHDAAASLAIGQQSDFSNLWQTAAELLTSYSDSNFVSAAYGQELARARTQAIEVERVSDDPPERVTSWLSTVKESQVRRLDGQVLLDLLTIEQRLDAWRKVLDAALTSITDLISAGEIQLARKLLDRIIAAASNGGGFGDPARAGLDRLRTGSLMAHVVAFIRHAPEDDLQNVSAFCRALGPQAIKPLAEALASEHGTTVRRLRDVVLSFGPAVRGHVDELRASSNPAVRRTAVDLLRDFGGAEALGDLSRLLDDLEPTVQREAIRAIVQIGTADAYATLQHALSAGDDRKRETIMQALGGAQDDRAVPLFVHILEHSNHRGRHETMYRTAIAMLGRLSGNAQAVAALKAVLYRSEWWAPGRTARLRAAAATALRSSGSAAAQRALEEAASQGPRGVREVARGVLTAPASRPPARRTS